MTVADVAIGRVVRDFDLRLDLSQVDVDVPIDAEAFRVRVPPSTTPMSLADLRESGPLAAADRHAH
mgnify:CR=1 FL=1